MINCSSLESAAPFACDRCTSRQFSYVWCMKISSTSKLKECCHFASICRSIACYWGRVRSRWNFAENRWGHANTLFLQNLRSSCASNECEQNTTARECAVQIRFVLLMILVLLELRGYFSTTQFRCCPMLPEGALSKTS